MKYWEIIADNLKKAGWSLGWVRGGVSMQARNSSGSLDNVVTQIAQHLVIHSDAERLVESGQFDPIESFIPICRLHS